MERTLDAVYALSRDILGESGNPLADYDRTILRAVERIRLSGVLTATAFPYLAAGDGVTDDTAAIQAALLVATAQQRGGTVALPRGDYRITNTITIPSVTGLRVVGDGGGSRLIWAGAADRPLLRCIGVQHSLLSDFSIVASAATPLATGIQLLSQTGATFVSRANRLVNLNLDGITTGLGVGIQIGGAVGGALNLIDANNDFHVFDQVSVSNFTDTAFSLENTQVYNLQFRDCLFAGGGVGQYGVSTTRVTGVGGNFSWIGGGGGGCTAADFSLSPHAAPYRITDATFETSARWIDVPGPSGANGVIHVEGCRWAADAVHADRRFIRYGLPGILILRGNALGNATPGGDALQMTWDPGGAAGLRLVVLEHNLVRYQAITYPVLSPTSEVGTVVYQG